MSQTALQTHDDSAGDLALSGAGELALVRPLPGAEPRAALEPSTPGRLDAFAKRAFDVVVAASVLLAFLPVLIFAALLVVLESPGGAFFRAERVGHRGTRLRMLKFRKMYDGAKGISLTAADDHRFTRIGPFLARTKLDELPQLWHVLKGDMSIVGPRPECPSFVASHEGEFAEITSVKPGITGWSQIAFAEESQILDEEDPLSHYTSRLLPQKIALDRRYAEGRTFWLDTRILFWTVAAVLARRQVAVNRATGAMNLRRR